MKIYVASSWRNGYQPLVIRVLREEGYEAYDFKNPCPGNHGFHWSEIDENWKNWNTSEYIECLNHKTAVDGYSMDFSNMLSSDVCILVLPCGRSAHIEAGYLRGAGKVLIIYIPQKQEPELMYKMAHLVTDDIDEMLQYLRGI